MTDRRTTPKRHALLSDEPVADADGDLIGVRPTAERLVRLLLGSRESTPFTLAVDAGWGAGKSSLMKMVEARLQLVPDVHTVWYNAWASDGSDGSSRSDALEGLIKSVLMRFDRRFLRRALQRVSDHRASLRVVRAFLVLLSVPLGVAGMVDRLWKDLALSPRARNEMRDSLRELALEWAESGDHEPRRLLVVFIDDLDRCSEECVLAVCEAVKIYLDVPGLAFVIGCDRSALGSNGLLRDLSPAGSAFMEKIFQTTYRIPSPGAAEAKAYARACAQQAGIGDLLDERLTALVMESCGRNPRRIKRLVNGIVLESGLNPLWEDFGSEAVIRTLLLQHLYADFYRMLVDGTQVGGDVITEFLEFRDVRLVLRPLVEGHPPETWERVSRFFVDHDVPPPERADEDGWPTSLGELEQRLPTMFPVLVTDREFIDLVERMMRLPESGRLIERLRQFRPERSLYGAAPDAAPYAYQQAPAQGSGDDSRADHVLPEGLTILWVDDHPENNALQADHLRRRGAHVLTVETAREAEHVLAGTDIDLMISDVQRGRDRTAGFDALERWRRAGLYTGPTIFYAGRETPDRRARAEALGASVTASTGTLLELVERLTAPGLRGRGERAVRAGGRS